MLSLVLLCVEGQVECQKCGGFSFAFAVELDYRCWRKCFISPTSQIEFNTKNKSHAPSNLGFIFAAIISIFWKFVTLFLTWISLLVLNSIIDVGESVSFLRPIELTTKNKLTAPPQFRFCFCCYHHPIFWKFVTLFLMGKKS